MPGPITSTMRRVLTNIEAGKPAFDEIKTPSRENGIATIPGVVNALKRRGLIRDSHRVGVYKLTDAGREALRGQQ